MQPEDIGSQAGTEAADWRWECARHASHRVQEMMDSGVPRSEILAVLVNAAEQVAGNRAVCSILVVDSRGLLRNAASPNLPADYLTAIDGLKPNPRVGTCAAAAATGSMVVTCDFQADDKWAELRHLPMSLGFVGAWSMPIKGSNGRVMGTFGTYFPGAPVSDTRRSQKRRSTSGRRWVRYRRTRKGLITKKQTPQEACEYQPLAKFSRPGGSIQHGSARRSLSDSVRGCEAVLL